MDSVRSHLNTGGHFANYLYRWGFAVLKILHPFSSCVQKSLYLHKSGSHITERKKKKRYQENIPGQNLGHLLIKNL